jgi:cell division transport system permease protein
VTLTVRETLLAFRRAPLLSALSVTTIAFAVFVVGLFGLVAVNLQRALDRLAERVEIVAYVLPGTPAEATTLALTDIAAFPEVAEAVYVTEEQALARARAELEEFRELYRELERNPLPASIEVRLSPAFRDAAHVRDVAERLRGFSFVEDVRYGRDWVVKLDGLRRIAAAVTLAVGGAFALVAVIIIGTTIRMAVLQRSREIAIMRLVGATDGFVRRPFLLEGALKGLLGGLLAVALSYAAYAAVTRFLFAGAFFTAVQILAIVGFGTVIGLLGSALSVGRHLRRV